MSEFGLGGRIIKFITIEDIGVVIFENGIDERRTLAWRAAFRGDWYGDFVTTDVEDIDQIVHVLEDQCRATLQELKKKTI